MRIRPPSALVELVEAKGLLLGGRVDGDRDRHEAEADGPLPHRPWHGSTSGKAGSRARSSGNRDSSPWSRQRRGQPSRRLAERVRDLHPAALGGHLDLVLELHALGLVLAPRSRPRGRAPCPGLISRSGFGGCGSSAKAALGPSSSRPAACDRASYRRARYRSGSVGHAARRTRANVMPGRSASRAAASQSWAARYVPALRGRRLGVAAQERPRQVHEVPLPAERVGVDEDELARAARRDRSPRGSTGSCSGPETTARVIRYSPPLRSSVSVIVGEDVDLADARLDGRLDRAHQPHPELRVDLEDLQLLGRLDLARVHAERAGVGDRDAARLQREEGRRRELVRRTAWTPSAPSSPMAPHDLVGPPAGPGLDVVEELPRAGRAGRPGRCARSRARTRRARTRSACPRPGPARTAPRRPCCRRS